MIDAWGWPQWFIAGTYMANILITSGFHGRPRMGKINAPLTIVMTVIGAWVLYKGGFWS